MTRNDAPYPKPGYAPSARNFACVTLALLPHLKLNPEPTAGDNIVTRAPLIAVLFSAMTLFNTATATPESTLQAALNDPSREAADQARDQRDRPDVTLSMCDIKPGDATADIFAGGGYYSELLSHMVGSEGKVLLRNNPPYAAYAAKSLDKRDLSGRYPNVENLVVENDDLRLPAQGVDAALLMITLHDLFYAEPESGWTQIDVADFLSQIHAALKPDGRLLIVDHAATMGAADGQSKTLHRIEEAYAQQVLKAAGFELAATSDILANPEDDHSKSVFDKSIRGHTDRFVHLYRKAPPVANRFYYRW